MPVRLRLPIAVVAALVVAEAAVLLMRPRDLVEPLDVAPRAYFSAAEIEKAANAVPGVGSAKVSVASQILTLDAQDTPSQSAQVERAEALAGRVARDLGG